MRFLFCFYIINPMKTILSAALASVAIFSLIFAIAPAAFADGGDYSKTYKGHWAISIGEASGTIEITEGSDIASLKEQAISSEEAIAGYENVIKARLAQAVNDSGHYFLVWKVVTESGDESDSTYTVNVLDAGEGNLLTSMTKEGGGCGSHKSGTTTTGGQA